VAITLLVVAIHWFHVTLTSMDTSADLDYIHQLVLTVDLVLVGG